MSDRARNSWIIDKGFHKGTEILLLTPAELHALPPETIVVDIFGEESQAGTADDDTRFGFTAFGVRPNPQPKEKPKEQLK